MAEYIDRVEYCEKHCLCSNEYCDRQSCPIWKAPAADVAPVVHARWITRSDKGVISMTHPYMCSRCWRVEMNKEPYCNCGAKMDGGIENASKEM